VWPYKGDDDHPSTVAKKKRPARECFYYLSKKFVAGWRNVRDNCASASATSAV
jgi:hypothetical protein